MPAANRQSHETADPRSNNPSSGFRPVSYSLDDIREKLRDLTVEEEVEPWLVRPIPYFDGRTAMQMMEAGESERLMGLLIRLEQGIPL